MLSDLSAEEYYAVGDFLPRTLNPWCAS